MNYTRMQKLYIEVVKLMTSRKIYQIAILHNSADVKNQFIGFRLGLGYSDKLVDRIEKITNKLGIMPHEYSIYGIGGDSESTDFKLFTVYDLDIEKYNNFLLKND